MPKQVDHDGRRRQIAEAVCLLVDEHGLAAVTLRDVATRAEVSMGAVQRCFRTKEEMLLFALAHIGERVTARVRSRLSAGPAQSAATRLGLVAGEVALLREEHRAEARIWLAFVAGAAVTPILAQTLRSSYAELEELMARLVGEAAGEALDPAAEARTLLALADGLTAHVLIGHRTAEEAEEVLHTYLAGLWARC
ncbi:TetR family transcriptional regulator [Streptomyces sp. 1114.5]|uniref:TetR/AcrR family transcriptional regulator n=1 Tax=unclassified Streptomyces TaxID=2593676 RepID=UPI000BC69392|nr:MULTISPECIES: TetR family transcriptional regulator C-terminal domain-containing protein [unclassified Streptomyces]RKT10967.1 TetR family transcriptional regulator [Streptomyces sp. 1114.5]SOB81697.1 transcriptional regulator, TetR family [Streptomyces sp. 1331.2]